MNKGCHRVKHGNKVRPAKKQENNGHPGSDTANDLPCGTHDPMCGKTSRRRVELIRSTIYWLTTSLPLLWWKIPYFMHAPNTLRSGTIGCRRRSKKVHSSSSYIPMADQVMDMFMKPLNSEKFVKFCNALGLVPVGAHWVGMLEINAEFIISFSYILYPFILYYSILWITTWNYTDGKSPSPLSLLNSRCSNWG